MPALFECIELHTGHNKPDVDGRVVWMFYRAFVGAGVLGEVVCFVGGEGLVCDGEGHADTAFWAESHRPSIISGILPTSSYLISIRVILFSEQ